MTKKTTIHIESNLKDVTQQCEVECCVTEVSFTCCGKGLDSSLFEIINVLDRLHLEQYLIVGEMTMFPARSCSRQSQTRFN